MATFHETPLDIRFTEAKGSWLAISGTLKDTGIGAVDGKKIVPAGSPVKGASGSIVEDREPAVVSDDTHAECLTVHEYDVTNGDVPATFYVYAVIDSNKVDLEADAITALKAKGFIFVG